MDRLYKTIWAKVKEGGELKRALFTFAYKYKKAQLLNGHTTPILDRCDTWMYQYIHNRPQILMELF